MSDHTISVLSADDHTMVRTGLQLLLEVNCGIRSFHEASSCSELLTCLRRHRPTHLITDMVFRDGNALEILPNVVQLFPNLRIMVYSMLPANVYLPTLARLGISLYLNKEVPQQQILDLLQYFLFDRTEKAPAPEPHALEKPFAQLSPRELEVLHYLLAGCSVVETAQKLNLHKNTVSTLKARIFEKTGVGSYKELLTLAALNNLSF